MGDPLLAWPQTFSRPDGRRFEISVEPWLVMQSFRQNDAYAAEAGGVLLGRHLHDGSAIIVDEVTTPMRGDRRGRTHFHRGRKQHQAMINHAWLESSGTCAYLGEWHTHPKPIPTPSVVDWSDWRRRLRTDQTTKPLFFVIVGMDQTRVWEGTGHGVLTVLSTVER
jgi:integrative and conjugative element protein (TIGR02256 family)